MVWEQIPLWQRILLYAFVLIALYIYVRTSQVRVMGRPLIPFKYRLLLALFFPVILVIGVVFGAFLIALVFTLLLIGILLSLLRKK